MFSQAAFVSVNVDGEELCLPLSLYAKLEDYAEFAGVDIENYISMIYNGTHVPECWSGFPEENLRLLRLYEFCLSDSERSVQALKNLQM